MAKLLYLKCSPRKDRSHSIRTADAFVREFSNNNPGWEVERVNIFEMELPSFDGATLEAKYLILHGKEHDQEHIDAWREVEKVIEQFKSADKYVIALPMWNFGVPYRFKQYIDVIVQPGYTFEMTEEGEYNGLLKGKKFTAVYARGGKYEGEKAAFDMQKNYVELIMGFMGIEKAEALIVEPTLMEGPEAAKEKELEAIEEGKRRAGKF
jgi:FMN-dependent NADH-azoreductase